MTCVEARDLFSALVDEALTPDERAELDRHLSGCAECREELPRFRRVVSLARAVQPERAPAGFVDRVLARTGPAPWSRRLARALVFPLRVKLPLGAAAAVLLGVLVSLLYRQSPELEQAARRDAASPRSAVEAPAVTAAPPADPYAPGPPASAPPAPQKEAARTRDAPLSKQSAPESREPGRTAEPSAPRINAQAQRQASEPAARAEDKREGGPGETPDLAGRLTVTDLAGAESALGSLVSRSGGRETGRRAIQDGVELEVEIPRARAETFTGALSTIGRWQAAQSVESSGDPVRVRIQLVR